MNIVERVKRGVRAHQFENSFLWFESHYFAALSVAVEIKTSKRKLLEYLLAPLQQYQDE